MSALRLLAAALMVPLCFSAHGQPAGNSAAEKKLEAERFALAKEIGRSVRDGLRDPDSLKFRMLGVSADARTACAHFQAKNGFGGMVQTQMIVVDYKPVGATAATWKKHCQNLIDHLYVVQR